MFHHAWHFGGSPPPPRVHFAYPNGSPILKAKYARKKYGRSAQSGRRIIPMESSRRPKWLNRKLRDRSRSTSCSAGQDGAASSGASKSFSIHAEYKFSVARVHVLRTGQTLPAAAPGGGGASARTAISRMIVLHSAGARSRASVARHVPAVGEATSANQTYGGPPCRSRDLAAMLPSGAISESSPSIGFSAAKTTRKGAPFHGAIGEGKTASSAASSQRPDGPSARASTAAKGKTKNAVIGTKAVTAAANWRVRYNRAPFLEHPRTAFDSRSQGRMAGYRIGEDQSAEMKAILQPAGLRQGRLCSPWGKADMAVFQVTSALLPITNIRRRDLTFCRSMIFSENRFPLFGITL